MIEQNQNEFDGKLLVKRISEGMIPLHNLIGIELQEVKDGFVSFRIPYNEKLIGDILNKRIHGGVISAAMDAAGGAVALLNFKNFDDQLSTINIQVNYLRRTTQNDLIIEATNVKNGSRVIFTEMKAYHSGDENNIVATGSAAYSYLSK